MKTSIATLGGMISIATGIMMYRGSEWIFWFVMTCVWIGFGYGVVQFFRGNERGAKRTILITLVGAIGYVMGINQASVGAWSLVEYSVYPALVVTLIAILSPKTQPRFEIAGQVKRVSQRGDEVAITLVTGEQLRGIGLTVEVGDEITCYPSRFQKNGRDGYHTVTATNLRKSQSGFWQGLSTTRRRPHGSGDARQQ